MFVSLLQKAEPTAIKKTATTTTTATIPNKRLDLRQRNQAPSSHGQTRRPACRPGRGRWCSIASPPAPCGLCLAERRRLAVAGMSHVTETEPTTPRASHPPVPFIKPHPATAERRASFADCGIEKCHVGDRDRLLSVTAGNWLSQHRRQERYWSGNGSATAAEIVSSLCGVFTPWRSCPPVSAG